MPPGSWIVDLDGVIWLAEEPIAGSADAVSRLRDAGARVVFASNNSAPRLEELLAKLAGAGIDAAPGDVITSAQAAASLLEPGTAAFVCGEAGLVEALEDRGVRVVRDGPADAVVVGWNRRFDFDLLAETTGRIRAGARFIATNEDATYPTPGRLLPGAGALLAAVATGAQAAPEVAGKPHGPMVRLIGERVPDAVVVVGDRPSTDGVLAQRLDVPFALVRSGVTRSSGEPMVVEPDRDAADLASLVAQALSGDRCW